MTEHFDFLTLADAITSTVVLDKKTVVAYAEKLYHTIEQLGIGDRECVFSASQKVIEWLSMQETSDLEKKDWFSIVRKLCTCEKEKVDAVSSDADIHSNVSQDVHRMNVSLLVRSNVVLRLINMCFSENEMLCEDETKIDFKNWYGRISLLCSFLECGWERLNIDQANALRYSAITILRMIPVISSESEKIFVRSILRVINKILHLVAGYEGHQEFSESIMFLYRQIIATTSDARDQENVLISLIMNLSALSESQNSQYTVELLWEMLVKLCVRVRNGEKDGTNEYTNISPHADFHKSLDIWLSNFIQATIQDSLEEKTYRREEVCNWIISTITLSTYKIKPIFHDFKEVLRTCLEVIGNDCHSLCTSLSRLYTKVMHEEVYTLDQQTELADFVFSLWNGTNASSSVILLKKIFEGDCSHSLLLRSASIIIEQDDFNARKDYLVLEDCIGHISNEMKKELAKQIVGKINAMDITNAECKAQEKLMNGLRHLNIVLEKKMDSDYSIDKVESLGRVSDLSFFNELLGTDEYTKMLNVSVEVFFAIDSERKQKDSYILPPMNVEYLRRLVNDEKLIPSHHLHYLMMHSLLSRNREYVDYLIAINGGPHIEPLIMEFSSHAIMDRIVQSMFRNMMKTREMFSRRWNSRYNSALEYIIESLEDRTISFFSSTTLEMLTETITSIELKYVFAEVSCATSDEVGARSRMLRLIQIVKCSLITQEERNIILDGVIISVEKAISSILASYNESLTPPDDLVLQKNLITILRYHIGMKDIHSSTICYMNLYLMDRGQSNSAHAFESLVYFLIRSLCESPTLQYPMESGSDRFGKAPLSPYITTPLMDRFTRLLLSLFSNTESQFLPYIDWNSVSRKQFGYLLDSECGTNGACSSLPLIIFLSKIIQGKNMREETRSIVMEYINKDGSSFVLRVMRSSPCKFVFFHALAPIIIYLRSNAEISSEVDDMLLECVSLLFSDSASEMLHFFPVIMQSTDRYAQTQLNWRSLVLLSASDEIEKDEVIDPISASFKLLTQLSTFKRLIFTLMETLGKRMQRWLMNIHEDILILSGVAVTPNMQVIWKVQLISQAFGYISCVAEEARKRDSNGEKNVGNEEYDSDKNEQEEKLLRDDREVNEAISCTFVNTSKEFTKQHWYNCYTCNMIESEGVCTVCALNCHRGHDLSYSKLGSFFCDCGAKKCEALRRVVNIPPTKKMRRMKTAQNYSNWAELFCLPDDVSRDEVEKYLKVSQEVLGIYSKNLSDLILGIELAYEGKFNIETRRERAFASMISPKFKHNECIMIGKIVENEGLEQLDRSSESMERNFAKECSEIIRLRDGSTVFLHVAEHSNYISILYMGLSDIGGELRDTRVERENLPFSPKRISVKNGHIAISGVDEMMILKISLDSGDIIQKDCISMKDGSITNPILKGVWWIGGEETENIFLAVATLQFVRIFNVVKDLKNHERELVLPVGNVVDLSFVKKKDDDCIWLLILSSPNHLYYYQIREPRHSVVDDSRSLYLTNTIPIPAQSSHCSVVSLHFSQVTRMLYISFQNSLYCSHIINGDVMNLKEESFHKLEVGDDIESLVGWSESDGMVAAVSNPVPSNKVIFIYPTLNEILVQVAILPQSAHSISLASSSTFESIMGLAILSGYRKPAMLFTGNWVNQPDLWMEHRPMKLDMIGMEDEYGEEESSQDQLITLFERCNEVKEVEFMCKELEDFYSSADLTSRLKTPERMSIISLNRDHLHIACKVQKRQYEVKGLRLELDGSTGPKSLSYNGKEMKLKRRMRSIYDIFLTPNDTINLDRPLTISIECNECGPTTIISLRAFGICREDLYARCLIYPSLSLPYQCVLNCLRMIHELWEYNLHLPTQIPSDNGKMREWIVESCLLVITPRTCRPDIIEMGKKILRSYWKENRKRYYEAKDSALIRSLKMFEILSPHLPPPVIHSYLTSFQQMISSRYENMVIYTEQFVGDVVAMGALILDEINWMDSEESTLTLLLSIYLQYSCSLLSNGHHMSSEIIVQIIQVITNHKIIRVWKSFKGKLKRIVRESLTGVGLKGGEWIEMLTEKICQSIVSEIRMPIPVWSNDGVFPEEDNVDLPFQRALDGLEALVDVGASLIRELEENTRIKIIIEMIDRVDTHSSLMEEEEARVNNVRMLGVIGLIIRMCKGIDKKHCEDSNTINMRLEDEDKKDIRRMKYEKEDHLAEIQNGLIYPLLEDVERTNKLILINFQLMEESLKFISNLSDVQKMDSGWSDQRGRLSSADCIFEYYVRMGKWTLEFPSLFISSSFSCVEPLSQDYIRIICAYTMIDKRIRLWKEAENLLYHAFHCDRKKYFDSKNEYLIIRNLDILRFEYLPKFWYTHQDHTCMIEIISRVKGRAVESNECWRRICEANLGWILVLTCKVIEPVGAAMLELLQTAFKISREEDIKDMGSPQPPPSPSSYSISDSLLENNKSTKILKVLIMTYLLGRDSNYRWLMHTLCRSLMQLASRKNQILFAKMLFYEIVPIGRSLGERAAQLYDLCSAYLPSLLSSTTLHSMVVEELRHLEAILSKLENSEQKECADWMVKAGMGWREALYLSSDPCIDCLRPNKTMETIKINQIKLDGKFTTNALMYKLNGHYEIGKIVIKLADMKKTRMFHQVGVYYTWKAIESAVELKSNREMWKEVATSKVSSSDNEVTLTVSIPIITNGLVIELVEKIDDSRLESGEVHCPRCSSLVRPNPGVCDNCGENVYQCVKCRSINYDEKEPFLCSSCGYCKYARIEISIVGRLQPRLIISADNDKPMASRASKSMNKLQWEMDTSRSQLRINSLIAQSLAIRHTSKPIISYEVDGNVITDPSYPQIAQIGLNDPRSVALKECMRQIRCASDSLVSQSLQLMSIREAMRTMEHAHSPALHETTLLGFDNASDIDCIGCLTASIIHSLSFLRSCTINFNIYSVVISNAQLIYNRLVKLSESIDLIRDEIEYLMIRLCEREEGVIKLCDVVIDGRVSASVLARSLIAVKDIKWSERMDTLLQCAMKRGDGDIAQMGLLHVFLNCMRESKGLFEMMEGRSKIENIFMEERGSSCSDITGIICDKQGARKEYEDHDESCIILDDIINNKKKEMEIFLWRLIFSPSIFIRSLICRSIRVMISVPGQAGLVMSIFLIGISRARRLKDASRCHQFFLAFNCLIDRGHIKLRLFQSNFHLHLLGIILTESIRLTEWERGEHSVSHASGEFVYHCTNLLTNVLSGSWLESVLLVSSRLSLIVPLLHSSILLRRVTIKRNRPIQRALHQLESLLRRSTVEEGLSLLIAAVTCLSEVKDEKTRADVVGVVLETLDPRENESDEFLIQIEKDAGQEDFLQGRMQQNPYKSGDASMGPLMRDIKNKICRECELIAFLEDDNGMELLVSGKIISLSLGVKAVYDGLWNAVHPGEAMVVVYRMRGLMGDAVEPFVESIDNKTEGESVGEEESRLLFSLLDCGGVKTTLNLLLHCSLTPHGCLLLVQLRKLLVHLLRVEKIKKELINCGGVSVLLSVIKKIHTEGMSTEEQSMATVQIDLLKMINTLVSDPQHHSILFGISGEECDWLLSLMEDGEEAWDKRDRPHSQFILEVSKILGNAVLGSKESEYILVKRIMEGLNWEDLLNEKIESINHPLKIGRRRRLNWMDDIERRADFFTLVVDGILPTQKGISLKNKLIGAGIIESAVTALLYMHPPLYGTVESPQWKTYLSRPALRLILRLLRGMAKGDEKSQIEVAKKALPMLHRLEQVSSAEYVGTLAENVMEALSQNIEVAAQIEKVRDETKQKKRQMAMAMREKQLSKLGMQVGRGGEVKVSSRCIVNEPELGESSDPLTSCCICRESILTGTRVPAAYAFAVPYRSHENVPTHCSLSLSIMVHADCHYNAIRRSNGGRNADEWTKAALHNSGARCNMLLPIPVASPSTSDWNAAISRMESDLEGVVSGGGPITRYRVFLDMCNLIRKFILNRSFSETAGGGGRESNMQYLGILHLLALHLPEGDLACNMASERINSFLLTELTVKDWNDERMDVLRAFVRDIELRDARGIARDSLLRESLLQWAFIDLYFNRVIPMDGEDRLQWLKERFATTLAKTVELVKYFDTTLLPIKRNEELAQIIGVDLNEALSLSTATTPT